MNLRNLMALCTSLQTNLPISIQSPFAGHIDRHFGLKKGQKRPKTTIFTKMGAQGRLFGLEMI